MKNEIVTNKIYKNISDLLHKARQQVKSAVNTTMVYTYFEIGRIIVEEEQSGKERAGYGKKLIKSLSIKLTKEFGKGFSVTNLKQMKTFYIAYGKGQKRSDLFKLGFSQYLILSRMRDINERSFYEIEAVKNNWNIEELERHTD